MVIYGNPFKRFHFSKKELFLIKCGWNRRHGYFQLTTQEVPQFLLICVRIDIMEQIACIRKASSLLEKYFMEK